MMNLRTTTALLILLFLMCDSLAWYPNWTWDNKNSSSINQPITSLSHDRDEDSQAFRYAVFAGARNFYLANNQLFTPLITSANITKDIRFTLAFTKSPCYVRVMDNEVWYTRWDPKTYPWQQLIPPNLNANTIFTSILSLETPEKVSFVVGSSEGNLYFCDTTFHSITRVPTMINSAIRQIIRIPLQNEILIVFENGLFQKMELTNPIPESLSQTITNPKIIIPYASLPDEQKFIVNQKGALNIYMVNSELAWNSAVKISPDSWSSISGEICHMVVGSDRNLNDLLIVGFCSGQIWSIPINTPTSAQMILQISDTATITEIRFNYVQGTSSSINMKNFQRVRPVIIISKSNNICLMYDLDTQETTLLNLYNAWGVSVSVTSNLLFRPFEDSPTTDNPNQAYRAHLAVGLSNGKIFKLQNLFFMQTDQSSPYSEERIIFNNGSSLTGSFLFEGIYQTKQYMSWAAIIKSIVTFYLPGFDIESEEGGQVCQLYSDFISVADDLSCCEVPYYTQQETNLSSSYEALLPECAIIQQNIPFSIITGLDQYLIKTIYEQQIPSYNRIMTEIINNHPIIILFEDTSKTIFHQIIIIGYQPNYQNLIIWDPNPTSFHHGESFITYYDLKSYLFTELVTLQSIGVIYTR